MLLHVTVPDGLEGGDDFTVASPSGEHFTVTVPDGVLGGMSIEVDLPVPDEVIDEAGPSSMNGSTEMSEVIVPEGVGPGEVLAVTAAWGGVFEVVVPEGVGPGMAMQVELPCGPSSDGHHYGSSDSYRESRSFGSDQPQHSPPPQQRPQPSQTRSPLGIDSRRTTPPSSRIFHTSAFESIDESRSTAPAPMRNSGDSQPDSRSGAAAPLPSRFGSRFGASRGATQQYFFAANNGSYMGRNLKASALRTCRGHELRLPKPEDGFMFWVGQKVQVYRSAGQWSIATVLEAIDGFTNYYKCRLGEGTLEKNVEEDSVRLPQPDEGFGFYIGQPVELRSASGGDWEPATVVSTFRGMRRDSEAMYKCALLRHENSIESVPEDRLQLPQPQPGCEFYPNQLVQMEQPGGTYALARVTDVTLGAMPVYDCKLVSP